MNYYTEYASAIGDLVMTSDGDHLTGLYAKDHSDKVKALQEERTRVDDLPAFMQTKAWLDAYFSGKRPDPEGLPLKVEGTDFQKKIWQLLLAVPYGETTTYGALARRYEESEQRKTSPRAVGSAVGRNPILILIPCHRVIGSDGSLTGYAAGLEKKVQLLQLEGSYAPEA